VLKPEKVMPLDKEDLSVNSKFCTRCRLHEEATQSVPGEGNENAEVMLVGEGPGKTEDEKGRPFVGRGGKKLEELLESQSISREETYITNIVKHRPPENRTPRRDEIEACFPFLRGEIEQINPSLIVPLGNTATREFLDTNEGITSLRGETYSWENGTKLLPTYHPSYLLRNLSGDGMSPEEEARLDFKRIKEELA